MHRFVDAAARSRHIGLVNRQHNKLVAQDEVTALELLVVGGPAFYKSAEGGVQTVYFASLKGAIALVNPDF